MAYSNSGETDPLVDLESGETDTSSGEDQSKDLVLFPNKMLSRMRSGSMDLSILTKGYDRVNLSKNLSNSCEKLEILVNQEGGKAKGVSEKKISKEKRKKTISKKPPKPPLPPRGPLLNEADMKLVRENQELARLRHARSERIKEVKKKRTDKTSSSNANMFAIVITLLFFFVIIFQGILGAQV